VPALAYPVDPHRECRAGTGQVIERAAGLP
jgi:hypothetical protein